MAKTLYDKLFDSHVIDEASDGTCLLYIDRHLVHEVTSPQAFEGLELANRAPWRVSSILAVADHNVPTTDRAAGIADPVSRLQVDTLVKNCEKYGITLYNMGDLRQGDRKSTRLNSSHVAISYAVYCLKKTKQYII